MHVKNAATSSYLYLKKQYQQFLKRGKVAKMPWEQLIDYCSSVEASALFLPWHPRSSPSQRCLRGGLPSCLQPPGRNTGRTAQKGLVGGGGWEASPKSNFDAETSNSVPYCTELYYIYRRQHFGMMILALIPIRAH